MSEVLIASLGIFGTIIGTFLGHRYAITEKNMVNAMMSYVKDFIPVKHSAENLWVAHSVWNQVREEYENVDLTKIDDKTRRELLHATGILDNETIDFSKKLTKFNESIARSIVGIIDKDLATWLAILNQSLKVQIEDPPAPDSHATILTPKVFPFNSLVIEGKVKQLPDRLNKVTTKAYFKNYPQV